MFVGDRSGTIHKVSDIGDATSFASLEPSMAAYHLAYRRACHEMLTASR